jgi:2-hydroxychromene-2-carboxylate isomerase
MTGVSSTYFPDRGRSSASESAANRQIRPRRAFQMAMGDLISLKHARSRRPDSAAPGRPRDGRRPRISFFFDLASPWTYLAAERAERMLPGGRWRPATGEVLLGAASAPDPRDDGRRDAAERRAAELRLPLVWPERWPAAGQSAMRVAAMAAEQGHAAPFVLAAGRLAFCGGYDLDDPEVIAEAAAAAGLGLDDALAAAAEVGRDGGMERTAMRLLRRGADELPVAVVGRRLFAGEGRLAEAAAAAASPPPARWKRSAGPG